MAKTTLGEAIKKAVRARDAQECGRLAEVLRDNGLNYQGIYDMVQSLTGLPARDWETLLYDSEETSW
jgi:hypothetical protein